MSHISLHLSQDSRCATYWLKRKWKSERRVSVLQWPTHSRARPQLVRKVFANSMPSSQAARSSRSHSFNKAALFKSSILSLLQFDVLRVCEVYSGPPLAYARMRQSIWMKRTVRSCLHRWKLIWRVMHGLPVSFQHQVMEFRYWTR
jgi:hypothetical protein